MTRDLLGMLRRGLRKPPKIIIQRIIAEITAETERFRAPRRARKFNLAALLKATKTTSLNELWNGLSQRPYPAHLSNITPENYQQSCPADQARILSQAQLAIQHQINLLGSGPINLGNKINWHKDYKSGFDWPPAYMRSIDYNNPERASDVKFPWEISRMQWLIPAGQAYLLTRDEKYAQAVKGILDDWIKENPYAHSINWACTMDVALRILTWTWFFQVFHDSKAWADDNFRARFLCALFLHGDFTERHLERSDINGNHYTADAAGLVFAGLFFGRGAAATRWQNLGWEILTTELPRQVLADGVDFEASVPYHRLVLELFFLPALYRQVNNLPVADSYKERVIAMARFSAAYSRDNGTIPLWGDADDARALPFGAQDINDHRYLAGLVGAAWQVADLLDNFSGSNTEIYWILKDCPSPPCGGRLGGGQSRAFPDGGFYIMRNPHDHIFIDCGPIGLAGRGGHGHNDCLSFEAVLDGEHLISDCGAYLYTASYQERNNFRSTAYHNTPQIDGEEINRFIRPDYLWNMHYDAVPKIHEWTTTETKTVLCGSHAGYQRLSTPVTLKRTFVLEHQNHLLTIQDEFESQGKHQITIPFHLAPNVLVGNEVKNNSLQLRSGNKTFLFSWESADPWQLSIEDARISPSYGVVVPSKKLVLRIDGLGTGKVAVQLRPQ